MTTFILVRHASVDTIGKSLSGWTPGIHLNAVGRAQAERLAQHLTASRAATIYSSPLERTRETANCIASRLGIPVEICERLGEIHCGEWTGRDYESLSTDTRWRLFNTFRSGTRVPGGEMMIEAQARVVAELQELRERHSNQAVIVVSHADVIRSAVAYYAGIPIDMLHRIEISPASISILELAESYARLVCLNAAGWPDEDAQADELQSS